MSHKKEFKHDVVRESIVSVFGFVKSNKTVIIRYSSIVIIAIFLLIAYNRHQQKSTASANQEYGKAINAFIDGNSDMALIDLQSVIDNYNGRKSSVNARLYLIQNEIKSDEFETAKENIKYVLDHSDDPQIIASMWYLNGNIAFHKNNYDACKEYYEKAIKAQPLSSLADEYKVGLARLYIAQNEYGRAKDLLNSILEDSDIRFNVKNDAEDLQAEVNYRLK